MHLFYRLELPPEISNGRRGGGGGEGEEGEGKRKVNEGEVREGQ